MDKFWHFAQQREDLVAHSKETLSGSLVLFAHFVSGARFKCLMPLVQGETHESEAFLCHGAGREATAPETPQVVGTLW